MFVYTVCQIETVFMTSVAIMDSSVLKLFSLPAIKSDLDPSTNFEILTAFLDLFLIFTTKFPPQTFQRPTQHFMREYGFTTESLLVYLVSSTENESPCNGRI